MLAFPSNHYKDKIRSRKSTPKLSAYFSFSSSTSPYSILKVTFCLLKRSPPLRMEHLP